MTEDAPSVRACALGVVLVVVVALAGCNAFSGAGGGDDPSSGAPEGEVTPAPVPTDPPTPTPGPADVPGLSPTGIENGAALFEAHAEILRNRSFTVRYNYTTVFENGTVLDENNRTIKTGTGSRFFVRTERDRTTVAGRRDRMSIATEFWSEGNRSFSATFYANGTTEYTRLPSESGADPDSLARTYAPPVTGLDADRSRVAGRVEGPNRTLYRIEGQVSLGLGTDDATVTALVGPRGRIHAYSISGPSYREGLSRRVTVRYTDVGSTTVERPSWYEEAVANATTPERVTPPEPPTPTGTPAEQPTNDTIVPGVTDSGVENGSALLEAHTDSLRNRSFTVRYNSTAVFDNGSVAGASNTTTWVGSGSRFFVHSERSEWSVSTTLARTLLATEFELWSSGNRSFGASFYADSPTEYVWLPPERSTNRSAVPGLYLSAIAGLTAENSRVAGPIEGPNGTLYRIEGEYSPVYSEGNVTVSALVDARGRIHEYRATGLVGRENSSRRIRVRYTDVGSTSVERPSWYVEARENATTPEPITPTEPQTTEDTRALGITREGLEDPFALASAHADALNRTSFTYRYASTQRYANGSLRARTTRNGRFGASEGHYYAVRYVAAPAGESGTPLYREEWSNGGRVFVATTIDDRTNYSVLPRPADDPGDRLVALPFDPTPQQRLSSILLAMNVSVENESESGPYRLTASGVTYSTMLGSAVGLADVRNATLTATVNSRGIVRRYRLDYTGVSEAGVEVNGTRMVRYTGIGTTSVERPSWHEEARENATTPEPDPRASFTLGSVAVDRP